LSRASASFSFFFVRAKLVIFDFCMAIDVYECPSVSVTGIAIVPYTKRSSGACIYASY
jgi:hypothetical protein